MKQKYIIAHMKAALIYAQLSYCVKAKVGCVIAKGNRLISIGYNGTPPGEKNICEDDHGHTLPCVIHAERNALSKLEDAAETAQGCYVFVTRAPCYDCAERLVKHKVHSVYYKDSQTDTDGIELLEQNGIIVKQIIMNEGSI